MMWECSKCKDHFRKSQKSAHKRSQAHLRGLKSPKTMRISRKVVLQHQGQFLTLTRKIIKVRFKIQECQMTGINTWETCQCIIIAADQT